MTRAALYARYSSDLQSDSSVDDQLRDCRQRAKAEGWTVVEEYSDRAISGASLRRDGITNLLVDAKRGAFDVVLTESLDRLSRDLEDVAGLFKRLTFAQVRIVTLSEGEVSELHVGLKGTMGALFLKDLAAKTRRGLRGRVEAGRSGGGRAYGYAVVRKVNEAGELVRGDRKINQTEARIVRRIFEEYAAGKSPRAIADGLNRDGIRSPAGKGWGASTINGNPARGLGILNNELYVGRLVWNTVTYRRDPVTGARCPRVNDASARTITAVPHLRIIPEKLWNAVRERQRGVQSNSPGLRDALARSGHADGRVSTGRYPKFIFSSLLKCAQCGSNYVVVSSAHYGCARNTNQGPHMCSNHVRVRRRVVEERLLEAIKTDLFTDDMMKDFAAAARAELKRLAGSRTDKTDGIRRDLAAAEKVIENVMNAIKAGILTASTKAELEKAEGDRDRLKADLTRAGDRLGNLEVLLPRAADRYRRLVSDLGRTITREVAEARRVISGLVGGAIKLRPTKRGGLVAELTGDYAGLLNLVQTGPRGRLGLENKAGAG